VSSMIRLFHDNNIDFLKYKAVFICISVALVALSTIAVLTRGFNLGVDFAGGMLVTVRFVNPPEAELLRRALADQGVDTTKVTLQPTAGAQGSNDGLLVRMPIERVAEDGGGSISEGALLPLRRALAGLAAADGVAEGMIDLNNVRGAELHEALQQLDPLGTGAADPRYATLRDTIVTFRDKTRAGVISSLDELPLDGYPPELRTRLGERFFAGNAAIVNAEVVGPQAGAELRDRAIYATVAALAGMLVFIALRFEWVYGVSAVLGVFYTVQVCLGLFALFQWEINYTFIAAMLTLVGYATNDTIVVFDRIRETQRDNRHASITDLVNRAVNQTLSRTVISAGTAFTCVLVLTLFGGDILKSFSLVLFVGIVTGTYASIAIASPIMLWLQARQHATRRGSRPFETPARPGAPARRSARLV